ncbi:venom dipeptidyl peptidase 4 [Phthorimaea operculella]|nr:venom dipeptidyl peptidase 4 [Phthorimaea operculella]
MARGLWWFAALLAAAAAQTPVTMPEWLSGQFGQRGFNGTWISDTEFTYTVADPSDRGIYVFDVPTLEGRVLVPNDLMEFLNTSSPILSADREYILAPSAVQQVYRYSRTALYTLYNINSTDIIRIADHQRLQLCIFGGGHSLAYVLDNNVYYLPENSSQPIQLTSDGIPGVVYNGHTDWVYEEDVMSTGQATWFSTDGSYLAFASFDDTEVDTYSYYYWVDKQDPDDLYPELVDLKYPKVGHKNPDVRLRVVDLNALTATGNITFIEIPAPEEVTQDHVLGGVTWPTADEVAVHWLNRRQNFSVFRIYKISNGAIASYEQEIREAPNGWVPIPLPRFGRNGDFYISTRWSERQTDGIIWQHLVISQRLGGQIISTSVTPGFYTVNSFIGMNEDLVAYYYTRTVQDQPWRTQVHVAGARDGCVSCDIQMPEGGNCSWVTASASLGGRYLTVTCSSIDEPSAVFIIDPWMPEGGNCSWVTASASLGGRYLTVTCSSIDEPSAVFIIDPWTATVLYTWEDNAVVRQNLIGKQRPTSLIFNVPLENGFPAPVRLHLPPGLDMNDTNTKYPMIFHVYSGPGTNAVQENFAVGKCL